jgi:hypothetical protein
MKTLGAKPLIIVTALYMAASLAHFIHNAEFLSDYPNLPGTWTRGGVYGAWLGMTLVGAVGLILFLRGHARVGLVLVAVYSLLGMDSLGHYFLAPLSAHAAAMNVTILLEVGMAVLVFLEVTRHAVLLARKSGSRKD